jgi:hypothetical protein
VHVEKFIDQPVPSKQALTAQMNHLKRCMNPETGEKYSNLPIERKVQIAKDCKFLVISALNTLFFPPEGK